MYKVLYSIMGFQVIHITSLPIDINKNSHDIHYNKSIGDNDVAWAKKLLSNMEEKIEKEDKTKLLCNFLKDWFIVGKFHTRSMNKSIYECILYNAKQGDWLEESFYTYFGEKLSDHVDPVLREKTWDINGDESVSIVDAYYLQSRIVPKTIVPKRKCIKNYNS